MNPDFKKKFDNAPHLVKFIQMAAMSGTPIGASLYDEAIEKHPEYFPKEVELKRKWESIPENIMLCYKKECEFAHEEAYKGLPENKGLVYWVNNKEEFTRFYTLLGECSEKHKELLRQINEKYLKPYGIPFD